MVERYKGRFLAGHKKRAGRRHGSVNKLPLQLKEAILEALALLGKDGKGKDGAVGFFVKTFAEYPDLAIRLVEKILPMQITGAGGGPVQLLHIPPELMVGMPTEELQLLDKVLARVSGAALSAPAPALGDAGAYAEAIGVSPAQKLHS